LASEAHIELHGSWGLVKLHPQLKANLTKLMLVENNVTAEQCLWAKQPWRDREQFIYFILVYGGTWIMAGSLCREAACGGGGSGGDDLTCKSCRIIGTQVNYNVK
jgi:hypothetical protein